MTTFSKAFYLILIGVRIPALIQRLSLVFNVYFETFQNGAFLSKIKYLEGFEKLLNVSFLCIVSPNIRKIILYHLFFENWFLLVE